MSIENPVEGMEATDSQKAIDRTIVEVGRQLLEYSDQVTFGDLQDRLNAMRTEDPSHNTLYHATMASIGQYHKIDEPLTKKYLDSLAN